MSEPHLAARLHGTRLKVFDNLHKSLVDVDKVGECIRVAGVPGGELYSGAAVPSPLTCQDAGCKISS